MEEGARLLLEGLGEVTYIPTQDKVLTKKFGGGDEGVNSTIDLMDPNFIKTPYRVAKMYLEICQGLGQMEEVKNIFSTSFPSTYKGMITIDSVDCFSLCPHHLLPVSYTCHFAYIPKRKMLGLSKVPRFIKLMARRPMLQEDLTKEIITTFIDYVKPEGAICILQGVHDCMVCRGVGAVNSACTTSEVHGSFEKQETRNEFFELLKLRKM